ncbi:31234_t:CDS:2, partial [Racocetra persica]
DGIDSQNKQKIQEIFNLVKVVFELSQVEVSIDFESKGYDLPSLDDLLQYYEKLEEFIDKLYYNEDIEA